MQTLLNHNNQPATIELPVRICNGVEIKDRKTWQQLTASDKQDIASEWIKDHVYCNVNQVMELLAQNDDHCDYDEYMSIAESQDYESAVYEHVNSLDSDELIAFINDYDLDVNYKEIVKTGFIGEIKKILPQFICKDDVLACLYDLECDPDENKNNVELKADLYGILDKEELTDTYTIDELESAFICLVPYDVIKPITKEFNNHLANEITKVTDDDEIGKDLNLDPEYDQAYEFYSVSDHFVAMTSSDLTCSNDILGLSVWARFCTGQSIVLDHAVQLAAFKALSDCSYQYY